MYHSDYGRGRSEDPIPPPLNSSWSLTLVGLVPSSPSPSITRAHADTANADGNPPQSDNIFTFSDGARVGYTVMPDDAGFVAKEVCSGDPHKQDAKATLIKTVDGQGDYLNSITFEYQYILGYCGNGGKCEPQDGNPELTLSVLPSWRNITNDAIVVYSSGHLSDGPTNGTTRHVLPLACSSPPSSERAHARQQKKRDPLARVGCCRRQFVASSLPLVGGANRGTNVFRYPMVAHFPPRTLSAHFLLFLPLFVLGRSSPPSLPSLPLWCSCCYRA